MLGPLLPLLLLLPPLCPADQPHAQGAQGYHNYRVTLRIADAEPLRDLPAFWSSTGFSAPSAREAEAYLLSEEMEWNLAYIGASPRAAVRLVRAHWLLQLVRAAPESISSSSRSPGWRWNFSLLDRFLDRLDLNGLRPGFEIMGNPRVEGDAETLGEARAEAAATSGAAGAPPGQAKGQAGQPLITNITDQAQLWARLVRDTIVHCGERYGPGAVARWRFETWNEPDLAMYNSFNWTVDGYMAYFNATVRGVREAQEILGVKLRLGGPAGIFKARRRHPICWHVLEHCDRLASRNLSCGLDFITFHRKGNSTARGVSSGTMRQLHQFSRMFPHLRDLPFANDEADPLTGWWRVEPWRADRRYAGMVVNTVVDLQEHWRSRGGVSLKNGHRQPPRLPPLEVLSNDNGFLETTPRHFEQRTLLSSFRDAGDGGSGRGSLQLFRKSVLTSMAMLSFVEGAQLAVQSDSQPALDAPLRLAPLASIAADRSALSLLIAFTNETAPADDSVVAGVHLSVPTAAAAALGVAAAADPQQEGREATEAAATSSTPRRLRGPILARVSSLDGDPSAVWRAAGSPPAPDGALRDRMRRAELPGVKLIRQFAEGEGVSLSFNMTLGCIALVQIFSPQRQPPLRVRGLRAMNVSYNEVFVLWGEEVSQSGQVIGYEVSFRQNYEDPFRVISAPAEVDGGRWLLFPSFHYAPAAPAAPIGSALGEQTRGQYRVAAVDAWGRVGPAALLRYPTRSGPIR
ncbi:alpha-L-iduronidase [Frankliniella occidentalis]|uniref:Alpha-L-iduronidase n=1 Tax=Frankliniella occidentalis TaxID=133901 RepID=A0A9C6TTJ1_FRAOC|nr:alpha-L-iduronidase [Frankliniella occidentalis]